MSSALRRERAIVVAALAAVVVLAWSYLLLGASVNSAMAMGGPLMPMPWTLATVRVMLVMWIAMMAGMMLPSAAPMILLFSAIDRRRPSGALGYRATALFAIAYLVIWAAFGMVATGAQWRLDRARLLAPATAAGSTALAGALFVLAGAYQLTPLKQACLRQCRSPLDFLTRYWHSGALGAFGMGLRHGLFCLGCCWAVMVLLFVGGLMNMLWVAALALFVFVEKAIPAGRRLGQAGGVVLILWGGATLLTVIA